MQRTATALFMAFVFAGPAISATQAAKTGPDSSLDQPQSQSAPAAMPASKPDADCDGSGTTSDGRADRARCRKLSDADVATAPITEIRKVSHRQVSVAGKLIAYTATAGTLTIRDDDGKPTASMFYVA